MLSSALKRRLRRLAISTLAAFFAVAGAIAWLSGDRPRALMPSSVRKILIIRLDLLGDLALSMPAVQAIRGRYPDSQLDMLVLPYTAPLLDCYQMVDHVYAYDIHALRPSGQMLSWARYRALRQLIQRLRGERYDLAVSLHGVWASALAFLIGAHYRVGYAGESFPFMQNLPVPGRRYRERRHELEYCLALAQAAGATGVAPTARPTVPAAAAHEAQQLLAPALSTGKPIVAIHLGAANGGAKRWTTSGWAEVARRLMDERTIPVVLLGTQRERALINEVLAQMPNRPLVLAGQTAVPVLLGVLERCALLLSGDSGPLHLAMALGVATVAIHGPSDPRLSGPYGQHARVVRLDVPCSPCYDLTDIAECPRGDPICMNGISADQVYAAALAQLDHGAHILDELITLPPSDGREP